ncbi:MAG: hypothetical protein SF187_00120 [Deltaproteobacteria bacterium]|nr:hypothetical protein [Deltaproteobacteria bacterium]
MLGLEKPLPRVALLAGALWLGGCIEADKPGTPRLVAFDVIDATGSAVMKDPDAAVFTATPRATFTAVFDNVLDFTQIVDVEAGVGLPGLVTITVKGVPAATSTVYTPNGSQKYHFITAAGPNISATPMGGLPSGASVVVALDVARLRGHNGQPVVVDAAVPAQISFETAPFGVTGEASDMPFTPDHAFVITASNIPGETFATKVSATSTVGAVTTPVEVTVTASEEDPTSFTVAPMAGMWPAGAKITVAVAADAADAFGVALGQPASIDFTVAAAAP